MPLKSASHATPHKGEVPNPIDLAVTDVSRDLSHILEQIQTEVNEIDTLIQICDQLLEKLQPHEPGKIRITWWKRTRQNELVPTAVKLKEGVGGRWYLDALPTRDIHKHIRGSGRFGENKPLTFRVATLSKELIRRRGRLLGLVRQHMSAISNTVPYQQQYREKVFQQLHDIYQQAGQSNKIDGDS